jgi:hypothetical protein
LEKEVNEDIGLKFDISWDFPFLNTGLTIANLNVHGLPT